MWAVELRREESRGRLEDLVGPAQLRVLLLQRLQLLRLRGRRPLPDTGVYLRLPHPLAQRLRSRDPQLRRDRPDRLVLRGIVLTVLPHQRDRALTSSGGYFEERAMRLPPSKRMRSPDIP